VDEDSGCRFYEPVQLKQARLMRGAAPAAGPACRRRLNTEPLSRRPKTDPLPRIHHFQWFGLDPGSARHRPEREKECDQREEWAEIRRLHRAEGMGIKAIARRLGVARNTVRSALRADDAPKYERKGRGSAVDSFRAAIRRLLAATPDMPATVVAERIGWTAWHHRAA